MISTLETKQYLNGNAKTSIELLRILNSDGSILKNVEKYLILELDRNIPGFGNKAQLINRKALPRSFSSRFQEGIRVPKDPTYRANTEEHLRTTGYDGRPCEFEDDVYGDSLYSDNEKTVIVPSDAQYFTPGKEIGIEYLTDEVEETFISDSQDFNSVDGEYGLRFHINEKEDGIIIDEDFFDFPLVLWNAGNTSIRIDGEKQEEKGVLEPGHILILFPGEQKRKKRRDEFKCKQENLTILPIWHSSAEIKKIEQTLRTKGCPEEDLQALAMFFWISDYCVDGENLELNEDTILKVKNNLRAKGLPEKELVDSAQYLYLLFCFLDSNNYSLESNEGIVELMQNKEVQKKFQDFQMTIEGYTTTNHAAWMDKVHEEMQTYPM